MSRLLFKKEGRAKFISHLDLMRTMQRVFIRAGVKIKHTEGFNPHPYMNFAMPLPVGTESVCELMDFETDAPIDLAALPAALNAVCPEGIEALEAFDSDNKFKYIKWLDIEARLFYYNKVHRPEELMSFYGAESIIMEKRTKRSVSQVDIKPLFTGLTVEAAGDGELLLKARLAVGEPALSPAQLISALSQISPELAPDYAAFKRREVIDKDMNPFR